MVGTLRPVGFFKRVGAGGCREGGAGTVTSFFGVAPPGVARPAARGGVRCSSVFLTSVATCLTSYPSLRDFVEPSSLSGVLFAVLVLYYCFLL